MKKKNKKYKLKTKIIEDIRMGLSKPKIAKKYTIGIATFEMLLREYNIDYDKLREIRNRNIVMDLKYQSLSVVAERYNISPQYIKRIVNKRKTKVDKYYSRKWALRSWIGVGYFMN